MFLAILKINNQNSARRQNLDICCYSLKPVTNRKSYRNSYRNGTLSSQCDNGTSYLFKFIQNGSTALNVI